MLPKFDKLPCQTKFSEKLVSFFFAAKNFTYAKIILSFRRKWLEKKRKNPRSFIKFSDIDTVTCQFLKEGN